jgi:hypothetical protein
MRPTLLLLGLGLALGALAQEPEDPPADTIDPAPPAAASTLPPDAALERHFPALQQRRLGEGADAFLSLWLPAAQPEPRGALLLIGDHGEHADWPDLIGPARRQLSEAGWHTLAMALPAEPPITFGLDEEALAERSARHHKELTGRLQLALEALRTEGDAQIPTVIIARGRASYWALTAAMDDSLIAGVVLFQPRSPVAAEPSLDQLVEQWDRPLLELTSATLATQHGQQQRALDARRLGKPTHRQWQVAELRAAPENQRVLIRRLQGWLERLDTN